MKSASLQSAEDEHFQSLLYRREFWAWLDEIELLFLLISLQKLLIRKGNLDVPSVRQTLRISWSAEETMHPQIYQGPRNIIFMGVSCPPGWYKSFTQLCYSIIKQSFKWQICWVFAASSGNSALETHHFIGLLEICLLHGMLCQKNHAIYVEHCSSEPLWSWTVAQHLWI